MKNLATVKKWKCDVLLIVLVTSFSWQIGSVIFWHAKIRCGLWYGLDMLFLTLNLSCVCNCYARKMLLWPWKAEKSGFNHGAVTKTSV